MDANKSLFQNAKPSDMGSADLLEVRFVMLRNHVFRLRNFYI